MRVGRFIHTSHDDKSTLPTEWTYPQCGRFEGCQVLTSFIQILSEGQHRTDDWFETSRYSHFVLLDVDGFGGESGGLSYRSALPEDVQEMRRMPLSRVREELTMIGCEMHDEGFDVELDGMGFPVDFWWEDHEEEIVDRLWERMEQVEPTFTDTLD